jgi:hypothetical protein
MADTRSCEQCGTVFMPRREHARFCSARCRVAWNRQHASESPAQTAALGWSITAMQEAAGRLFRASGWDRADGYAMVSEAVWCVTMVDATLVRYQPDTYNSCLARQEPVRRLITEDTFAGLRFVRNQMGYHAAHADFIQPLDTQAGAAGRVAEWRWRAVPEPALEVLTPRGQDWEVTRHRAYQARLAGCPVGESIGQATAFLCLAAEGSSLAGSA